MSNDPTTAPTDLTALFERARDAATAAHEEHELGDDRVGFVLPAGHQVHVVDLEKQRSTPRRKTGTVTLRNTDSLLRYLAHADDATWAYIDEKAHTITAVLNDHEAAGDAGWADHRAVLQLTTTVPWQRWTAVDGKAISQVELAELVEDRIVDIAEPAGADLLELAQSLQATKSVEFRSDQRLANGAVNLKFVENIEASAGRDGSMVIPTKITLVVAPFQGADPVPVQVRFRYRLVAGKLSFVLIIDQRDEVIRRALDAEASRVEALLPNRVLWGTRP